jgi:hypothetical protein
MRPLIIFCLLVLSACSTSEKPEVINTAAIRVSPAQCGPTSISKVELKQLGEKLRASALMQVTLDETVIVSFYSNRQSGDWTVVIDSKNGISCMVLWGKHWLAAGQES